MHIPTRATATRVAAMIATTVELSRPSSSEVDSALCANVSVLERVEFSLLSVELENDSFSRMLVMVGLDVGVVEGDAEGEEEGFEVGLEEGCVEGLRVGPLVGDFVTGTHRLPPSASAYPGWHF